MAQMDTNQEETAVQSDLNFFSCIFLRVFVPSRLRV
jgi:hypothetical protein